MDLTLPTDVSSSGGCAPSTRTWHLFLNKGSGFETGSRLDTTSPTNAPGNIEPASIFALLDVLPPVMSTTMHLAIPPDPEARLKPTRQ